MPAPSLTPLPPPAIDLSAVEALSDLPDDARDAFARGAVVRELAGAQEVTGWALALVIEGTVVITAAAIDAVALPLHAGAVVRGRGSIEGAIPLRLVASSGPARVATWAEHDIADGLRSCPWVEDDLRVAGDRVQALAGATMGQLGHRLDASLRDQVTSRLTLRVLGEHEAVARAGEPVSGLLVIGAGELELWDGLEPRGLVRPGEFLFPAELLRAAAAPFDVRAPKGGALVLAADRGLTRELLVTCPPLLEILSFF